jgi:hypothetical protein
MEDVLTMCPLRRSRTNFIPISVWFAAGVGLLLAFALISNPFLAAILGPLAVLGYGGLAILLLVAYVRTAIQERTRKSYLAVGSIPLLTVVLVLSAPFVDTLVVYAQFATMLPRYSRIVDAVTQPPQPDAADQNQEARYIVDVGPPVRVAFPKDGIVDNWWGIVYDPTDAVAQAKGWEFDGGEQRFTAPQQVKALFGGDLVSCRHLYKHYYSCSFT